MKIANSIFIFKDILNKFFPSKKNDKSWTSTNSVIEIPKSHKFSRLQYNYYRNYVKVNKNHTSVLFLLFGPLLLVRKTREQWQRKPKEKKRNVSLTINRARIISCLKRSLTLR